MQGEGAEDIETAERQKEREREASHFLYSISDYRPTIPKPITEKEREILNRFAPPVEDDSSICLSR